MNLLIFCIRSPLLTVRGSERVEPRAEVQQGQVDVQGVGLGQYRNETVGSRGEH